VNTLRVSARSDPGATAGAIAHGVRECGEAEIQAIGPRAVNQAIKAIAVARGYVAASGIDLYCVPSFTSIVVVESEPAKTAIHLAVLPRHELVGAPSLNSRSAGPVQF
jgi:stage V sporulation protein S